MLRSLRSASLALITLLSASSADASAIVSITGSGSVEITASGSIYFDASDLDLTTLSLEASGLISIGSALPSDVLDSSFDTLAFNEVSVISGLLIEGDLYFDVFEFAGDLTLRGENIFVSGQINALAIALDSGSCNADGGGAAVLASGLEATLLCDGVLTDAIDLTNGGVLVLGGGGLTPAGAIPEPTGALLFAIGGIFVSRSAFRARGARSR